MNAPCLAHYVFTAEEVSAALDRRKRDIDTARGVTFKYDEKGRAGPFFERMRFDGNHLIIDVFAEPPQPEPKQASTPSKTIKLAKSPPPLAKRGL